MKTMIYEILMKNQYILIAFKLNKNMDFQINPCNKIILIKDESALQ